VLGLCCVFMHSTVQSTQYGEHAACVKRRSVT
jgi:hypothetical protein